MQSIYLTQNQEELKNSFKEKTAKFVMKNFNLPEKLKENYREFLCVHFLDSAIMIIPLPLSHGNLP